MLAHQLKTLMASIRPASSGQMTRALKSWQKARLNGGKQFKFSRWLANYLGGAN